MKKFLLFIFLVFTISDFNIQAQPYIYFPSQKADTVNGIIYPYQILKRYNLKNQTIDVFPPQQFADEYIGNINEPIQSYMFISFKDFGYILYNLNDTSDYFNIYLDGLIEEFLYLQSNNELYIFLDDYSRLVVFDLINKLIKSTLNIGKDAGRNVLSEPYRNSFFSSDDAKIYFYSVDEDNRNKCWVYSLNTHGIINKIELTVLGNSESDSHKMTFGRKGKGIITSGPFYSNPQKDFYYNLYDFDNNISYPTIFNYGFSEAYFNGNGEFILILQTTKDSVDNYFHTGLVKIYNSSTGQLVKTITLPPRGVIYTFDNCPNDIYYVLNLDTQPEIYNLTKLELHQLSPAVALTSPFGSRQEFSFNVTAYGGLFTDSSVAYFNGQAKPTSKINDTTVSFTLSNTDIASTGNYPIWISNYGSYSDTLNFSVTYSLQNSLSPTFQCVRRNPDKSYTAYFGYNNNNSYDVFIPTGVNNRFSPSPEFRGQANVFISGIHQNVFTVNFNGDNLTWYLAGQSITVNKNSSSCP
ncbi:PKD domain protein [Ignavibacterium album JCM 16511]|uniref:PKD domain protein n=1 Tax=Ignavibacterium album (strain DSM 19864 / JCM 16511 / NBRC 101810 / Mat9-16) TaxID=945713 RepID=I0AMB8_IGNAJ|nr:hypothetical protein [Ignavibacterium album]AFH50125.1 PKD domain protein [Ignavibacterium album JCM 16511]